jgi:hypothetical protein
MTLSSDPLTFKGWRPSYSMKPSRLNLFRKKLTRERVVPIIWASVSCEIFGATRLPAGFFQHRELDRTRLNVHHVLAPVPLRVRVHQRSRMAGMDAIGPEGTLFDCR